MKAKKSVEKPAQNIVASYTCDENGEYHFSKVESQEPGVISIPVEKTEYLNKKTGSGTISFPVGKAESLNKKTGHMKPIIIKKIEP